MFLFVCLFCWKSHSELYNLPQVKDGVVSELLQDKASVRHRAGKNLRCGCQRPQRVRTLPGMNHVTYSWKPHCHCQKSFLEITYTDSSANSQSDLQSQKQLATRPSKISSTSEKSEPAAKGHVTPQPCNKWPNNSSLTLICNSRPSHTPERLPTSSCSAFCTSEKLEPADKGRAPLQRCDKWPVHNSLTLICDSSPVHTSVRCKTVENVAAWQELLLHQGTVLYLIRPNDDASLHDSHNSSQPKCGGHNFQADLHSIVGSKTTVEWIKPEKSD